MALKIYASSNWWYADLVADGKRKTINLRVRVDGLRPPSLRSRGDAAFEASRRLALIEHDRLRVALDSERLRHRMIDQLREVSEMPSLSVAGLEGFFSSFLSAQGRSEKYVKEASACVKMFSDALSVDRVDRISVAMVGDWWRGLEGSPRTRNKKKHWIQMLFRELIREGYLERSPAAGLRSVSAATMHREPFSQDEIEAMLSVAGKYRPLLVVGRATALRISDAAKIRWEDIDLAAGWVRVRTAKTGEVAEVPLSDALRAELPKKPKRLSGPVWPMLAAMRSDSLSKAFRKIKRAAGIEGNKDFHSFRVTWITEALSAGVPMEAVRRVTGHQTVDVVVRHYFRPGREDLRKSLGVLPAYSEAAGARDRARAIIEGLSGEQLERALAALGDIVSGRS